MKTIQFGTKTLQVPEKIAELSVPQLVRFVELQHAGLTTTQYKVWNMLNILDVQHRPWLKWYFFKNEYLIPFLDKITFGLFNWTVKTIMPEDLEELCNSFPELQSMNNFTLENPFPSLRIDLNYSQKIVGPKKLLTNIKFRQFRKAEEYYAKYLQKNEMADLEMMIAWLYMPDSKNVIFFLHPDVVEKRAEKIAKLSYPKKITLLYFYIANREKVTMLFRYLFPEPGNKVNPKVRTYFQVRKDLEKAVRILSTNINQDENTDFQDLHDALAHLNDKAEEAAKLKEMYDKQGK